MATLLTVIGEEAQEVFTTFTWETKGDEKKIGTVLDKYCQPRKIYLSSDIGSTGKLKSLVSRMISIVQLYEYCQTAVNLMPLHPMNYYPTD